MARQCEFWEEVRLKVTLSDMDAAVLREGFVAAGYEVKPGPPDMVAVTVNNLIVVVAPQPAKEIIKVLAMMGAKADRDRVIEFCNTVNDSLLVVRASVGDERDSDGEYRLTFDHDFPVCAGEKVDLAHLASHLERIAVTVHQAMLTMGGLAIL